MRPNGGRPRLPGGAHERTPRATRLLGGRRRVRGLRRPVEPAGRAAVPRLARRPRGEALARRRLRHRCAQPGDPGRPAPRRRWSASIRRCPFVAHAATQVADARAAFRKGDAQHLPVDHGSFDAVVSGLVLNFVPDQPAALREMRRAARPGGVVAAYVWDYADGMQLMTHFWDAAVEAAPEAGALREDLRFATVPAGSAARALPRRGSRGRRRGGDRRPHRLRRLRRLLVALPRRAGAGSGLCDVAARGGPGGAAGAAARPASPSRTTARSGSPPARGRSAGRSPPS